MTSKPQLRVRIRRLRWIWEACDIAPRAPGIGADPEGFAPGSRPFFGSPGALYVYRSIETRRRSGSFLVWKLGTYTRLAEKRLLPVYSRRLREAREAYGISQRNLGIEAGLDDFVASTRVNRYETGVHQPDLQTLQRLAAVLGLPVAYFYAEDDELAKVIREFQSKGKSKSKR